MRVRARVGVRVRVAVRVRVRIRVVDDASSRRWGALSVPSSAPSLGPGWC